MTSTTEAPELTLPTFTAGEPLMPAVKQKQPNPYEQFLPRLAEAVNQSGFSASQTTPPMSEDDARRHYNAIRRAGSLLKIGISTVINDVEGSEHKTVTFGVVPKRVRNTDTGAVETPVVATP